MNSGSLGPKEESARADTPVVTDSAVPKVAWTDWGRGRSLHKAVHPEETLLSLWFLSSIALKSRPLYSKAHFSGERVTSV